ncbi:bifunctional 2-polyprenyl-6-hydroxyphenol methylase/3-demethylubiquinol 3-O-methyltransferase UbiG [Neobittarella massiliensis]|uniref:class I SAM-dependent methyltransferase n=1 Tax=Neobittarella massiliensis (ex Bilen et al. 2018) TaxID=2041842 RepID=UPI000CF67AE3|nr:class I SAM-dependent methyltransferase [Neobittarella massiliensis]
MCKNNPYDDPQFFEAYSQMGRSTQGLAGAGEWYALRELLPDLAGKRVLDLGCGYGWHCQYAAQGGASYVLGLDISEKMLQVAREKNRFDQVEYRCQSIDEIDFAADSFDVVLSSLALHYLPDFQDICRRVAGCLTVGGQFILSVEHPVFTAYGSQDWYRDEQGNILHWPVDGYYIEGERQAIFLGQPVQKYHHTATSFVQGLLQNGFVLTDFVEPRPDPSMMDLPGMQDELRRPMMLLLAGRLERR